MEKTTETPPSYFGIKPFFIPSGSQGCWFVKEVDIEKLPFYEFWKESTVGSGAFPDNENPGKSLIFFADWRAFCHLFIKTGKHRYNLYKE